MDVLWLVLALSGFGMSVTFVVGYHVKNRGSWVDYAMGRHLMGFVLTLAFVFGVMAVSLVAGPLGPWPWIVSLAGVNVALFQRNWLLFTKKWREREDERFSEYTVRD